jgi:peptidyl-prolyl cis-trans isomerase C
MLIKSSFLVAWLALIALATRVLSAAEPAATNAASSAPSAAANDELVAKGKALKITRGQLNKEVARAIAQIVMTRRVVAEETNRIPRTILAQLINVQLIEAKATDADKAAAKEKAQKQFAEAKSKAGSEEAFERQLKRLGATPSELLAKWTEAFTADTVVRREIKATVTDQDTRKFYDENPTQFDAPERLRASHILFATHNATTGAPLPPDQQAAKLKQAEAVLKRAKAGEDFGKLAREFSDDTVSKDKGGEYTFAQGEMVKEVENAARALRPGEISDIVLSPYGYHIIKLIEKIPAHRIQYADAATDIKNGLTDDAIRKQFPEYIAKLRKEAGVEILDERLQPQEGIDPYSFLRPVKKADLP